jgi:hypothetical protein
LGIVERHWQVMLNLIQKYCVQSVLIQEALECVPGLAHQALSQNTGEWTESRWKPQEAIGDHGSILFFGHRSPIDINLREIQYV